LEEKEEEKENGEEEDTLATGFKIWAERERRD
jgi:hypothetical protein